MPAITRSQTKNILYSIPHSDTIIENNRTHSDKQIDNKIQLKKYFISYITKSLKKSTEYFNKTIFYKSKRNCQSLQKRKYYDLNYKKNYYFNLQLITEIFYVVKDWFDIVLVPYGVVPNSSIQRLIDVFYEKTKTLRGDINYSPKNPTKEESYTIKVCIEQLQETANILEPYVTAKTLLESNKKRRSKRNNSIVDYTGMDSIYVDQDDVITNIWEDKTIGYDPDYSPSEDYEEYLEDEEDLEDEEFVIEQVSSNHIRFVY